MNALGGARRRGDRGAAAVEFALVMPFLLLIVFGIMSYGYMFSVRQGLTQAAAEGARAAAVASPGDAATAAVSAVNEALGAGMTCGSGGVTCTTTTVTCDLSPCIRVTVAYAYEANTPVDLPFIPLPDTLQFTSSAKVN